MHNRLTTCKLGSMPSSRENNQQKRKKEKKKTSTKFQLTEKMPDTQTTTFQLRRNVSTDKHDHTTCNISTEHSYIMSCN